MTCVYYGNVDAVQAVKTLLEQGADLNANSKDGMTPLSIAAFWGYSDIVKLLLESGYVKYYSLIINLTSLILSSLKLNKKKTTFFYRADINASNKGTGWTPAHCAAFQGHGPVLLHLLSHDPDLRIVDSRNRSAYRKESVYKHFMTSSLIHIFVLALIYYYLQMQSANLHRSIS